MFFRSRNEKAETIEQTALADPHRLCGNTSETHFLDERGSCSCRFHFIRNCRKRVLFGAHASTSRYKLDDKSGDKKRSRAKHAKKGPYLYLRNLGAPFDVALRACFAPLRELLLFKYLCPVSGVFNNAAAVIKSKRLKTAKNAARPVPPSNPSRSPFHRGFSDP